MLRVTIPVLLLASDTKIPPAGAGETKVTGNVTDWFGGTVTFACSRICATFAMFTVAVPAVKPVADAVIVVVPPVPGVTVTFALTPPCEMVTDAGTTAIFGLLLVKLITWPPAPAGDDRVTVSVPVVLFPKLRGLGVSEIAGVETFTVVVPDVKPTADPVMVVVPAATGVTITFTLVAPGGTVTFCGTVEALALLLVRLIA